MFDYGKMIARLRNGWNNDMYVNWLIVPVDGEKRTMQVAFLETEVNDLHEMVNQAIIVNAEDNLIAHFKLRIDMGSGVVEGWAMSVGSTDLEPNQGFDAEDLGIPTEEEFTNALLMRGEEE